MKTTFVKKSLHLEAQPASASEAGLCTALTGPTDLKPLAVRRKTLGTARLQASLVLLLLLLHPAVHAAQFGDFEYETNGGMITISGYTGPGGAVTIPGGIAGLPVTSIGWYAFERCTSLTSVTIPNSVTSIGNWAFCGCTGLTNITLPNSVTTIGGAAFAGCTSLTSLTLPNSITRVGDWAFSDCTSLTSVTIPDSVSTIDWFLFLRCTSLTNVTIGNSVTNIGGFAFSGCTSLLAIAVDEDNPTYSSVDGVLFNKNQTTLILCPGGRFGSYAVPDGVTSIGEGAFSNCTGLTSVTIPSSVARIELSAFAGCTSLIAVPVDEANAAYSSVDGVLFNTRAGPPSFYARVADSEAMKSPAASPASGRGRSRTAPA